jgi:hypothetical protein
METFYNKFGIKWWVYCGGRLAVVLTLGGTQIQITNRMPALDISDSNI